MASNEGSANNYREGSSEENSFSECEGSLRITDSSDSDSNSQQGASQSAAAPIQACRYYNKGNCKYGKKCHYLHICQYFLRGACRHGSSCRLRHITNSELESSADGSDSRARGRRRSGRRRSSSGEHEAGDSRPFRWQINAGRGWMDIENDHIIEAQYSRPSAKGIRLYNTCFGVVHIDYNKMKVLQKPTLRVRRLSSSQDGLETEWIWYYSGNNGWVQYGEKDHNGQVSSVSSDQIERQFQSNPRGWFQFTVGTTLYQINFREMRQENTVSGQKRKVARRPRLEEPQDGGRSGIGAFSGLSISTPTWQFEGDSGRWYTFKYRRGTDTESSVSSADIEAQFQRNQRGSVSFTVSGQQYKLDFSAWTQTNLTSQKVRNIRRVLQ